MDHRNLCNELLLGMMVRAKADCVSCELCPVSFIVVSESPSVLLWSVVMSYVNVGDDG